MAAQGLQNMPVLGTDPIPLGFLDLRDAPRVLFEHEEQEAKLLINYIAGVGDQQMPTRRFIGTAMTTHSDTSDVSSWAGEIGQDRRSAGLVSGAITIQVRVNGRSRTLAVDPRTSLLDLLRERLALTGTKKGCDHGQCGACTIHLDGRRVVSCLTLAVQVDGREVTTIEGVTASDGSLHPMQESFIGHDALQCGYCTPGQIMAAIACVWEGHAVSAETIREYMSGNICRCGAYVSIVAAIEDAAPKMTKP
jgi:xanthine dehydrogenase YagT iron-sulfur-binding subunit